MRVTGACFLVILLTATITRGEEPKPKTLTLTVSETGGLRRFSYPVHVYLPITDEAVAPGRIRLLEKGKPVAAQFRPYLARPRDFPLPEKKGVALDFNTSIGPLEKKVFAVEYGPDVAGGSEPKGGLTVEESDEAITVRSGAMTYVVRRDLKGLLDEVRSGKTIYVKPGSAGLLRDDKPVLAPPGERLKVAYQGPLAVALRTMLWVGDKRKANTGGYLLIDITFPRSKSWVEFRVNQLEPRSGVKSLGASLNLQVEGSPTLVDLGAGSTVYTTLGPMEAATLTASTKEKPAWEVRVGKLPKPALFALPVGTAGAVPAEGWAHVMDNKRCTALAVEQFGNPMSHRILVEGNGKLTWTRAVDTFTELRFWLHFVGMPVQVGALTSPQSMMAPLKVEVK